MEKIKSEKEGKGSRLLRRIGAWWIDYFKVIKSALRGIGNDNVTILASGLVYSSLIAIVPCITFLFVFLSTFGVLQTFMELMTELLIELFGEDNAANLIESINKYSTNAMSLGVFGLVSFIVTGLFLVNKIYMVINQIFRTRPETGTVKRFFTFFVFLIVFTFLIAMSFALSNTLNARITEAVGGTPQSPVSKKLGSIALMWLVFLLLLLIVPNARVRFRSALVGATTGLVAMTIASNIFNIIIHSVVSYSVIYGTLASIFFLLLYLYIIWYIVITIAEVTYVHQYRPDKNTLLGRPQNPMRIISEAMNMILIISSKYSKGEGSSSTRELARKLAIPNSRLVSYLRDMEGAGIIMPTNTQGTSFVPARPLSQISLKRVIEILYGADEIDSADIDTIGEAVAMEFYSTGKNGIKDITIEQLLERV